MISSKNDWERVFHSRFFIPNFGSSRLLRGIEVIKQNTIEKEGEKNVRQIKEWSHSVLACGR